jgi:hypothetical protein
LHNGQRNLAAYAEAFVALVNDKQPPGFFDGLYNIMEVATIVILSPSCTIFALPNGIV